MCGIAGIWNPTVAAPDSVAVSNLPDLAALRNAGQAISDRLKHRGPDDQGILIDAQLGLCLAHRRLAILDLSAAGHQPMTSACGRWTLVFNGEIYNFRQLRQALTDAGKTFRGNSDTEVLIESIASLGVEQTLNRVNGMFAFAVIDRQQRQLSIARDRVGIKPLYFGVIDGAFIFSSEFSAIRKLPGFRLHLNRNAVAQLLQHSYIPAPSCIDLRFQKLMPGTFLSIPLQEGDFQTGFPDLNTLLSKQPAQRFWDWPALATKSNTEQEVATAESQFQDQFWSQLKRSVQLRLESDVEVGAFLSGGIDSPLVVAAMLELGAAPLKTFTIGFSDPRWNEADTAERIANHFGTDHHCLNISQTQMLEIVQGLPELYDEPFSDSSQIPTLLVSQMASQHVKVVLSGDGGDELFGGYQRYSDGWHRWKQLSRIPWAIRKMARWPLQAAGSAIGLPKLNELARLMNSPTPVHFYNAWHRHWKHPRQMVLGLNSQPLPSFQEIEFHNSHSGRTAAEAIHCMMNVDMRHYLPDDILTKVDRATMAVGLEARVPFLDHELIQWAAQVPWAMKFNVKQGKTLSRNVLRRHLPSDIVDGPKRGFGVPLDDWLRGPLKSWAGQLLEPSLLQQQEIFNWKIVGQYWQEHQSKRQNWQYLLWGVLMFQAWYQTAI